MRKKFFAFFLSIAVFSCGISFADGFDVPKAGDKIAASDYSDAGNWLSLPAKIKKKVDVFFVYPTAWRADGGYPIAEISNAQMRQWAQYYLKFRAGAFEPKANIFAPYYRQLDALFAFNILRQGDKPEQTPSSDKTAQALKSSETKNALEAMSYFGGVPATDILAAFDYYIKNLNEGRPFILVGHSQGSMMLLFILTQYMKENPKVYERMICAYAIGAPITKEIYQANPHLKPAQNAYDTGVIISYNTQSANVDGQNYMSNPDSVLINPLNWTTDETYASKNQNLGSLYVDEQGKAYKKKHIADAKIDRSKGVIICSEVDREEWSSQEASRSYFPLGVFHENDIPLYYYNLRQNADDRIKQYFKNLKKSAL
ncbi:MAG: DUF3089 domain-containing protein [Endomicrobium sp.]|nr:DUF3089 domain-containing protein [Endomicrobium sp.]